jgi:hypothetical protein
MDKPSQKIFGDLWSADKQAQNAAFYHVIELTDEPVDWAYELWPALLENLTHNDNHNRAIASQILSNLAKSDPDSRILDDLPALITVTKDKRFVTARHCLQSLWKIGVVGEAQRKLLLEHLERRYHECTAEKNWTLIRFDIIQNLRNIYDEVGDETVRDKALALIELEEDNKYRKKYAKVWC